MLRLIVIAFVIWFLRSDGKVSISGFYALTNKALRKSNMEKVPVNYDNTSEVYDTISSISES